MAHISGTVAQTCEQYLEELADAAVGRGIPPETADYCRRQTCRRLVPVSGTLVGPAMRRRLAAYFGAVVRDYVKRSRGPELARTRCALVLTTLAEDLACVGASRDRMISELRQVYGSVVPQPDIESIVDRVACSLAS